MELLELKEETVAQETVYEGIIVNVRRDQARLADGRVTNREVIEHPGGVAVFAVDEQERVIMVRQFRYPMGEVVLELPAGKLELKVDPEVLAERMKHFVPKKKALTGYLKRYAALVSSGASGAVLN